MRDTSDMMEDALSEDTMMDCGGDGGGLEDFVDLATDITDNSPTIRDAAERLLTLLGMDEDDDEDLLSSSEDEGVEVDISELEDDDEQTENTKLLHQLVASLAQELKYSQKQSSASSNRAATHPDSSPSVEMMLQNASYLGHGCLQDQADHPKTSVHQNDDFPRNHFFGEQHASFPKFRNFGNFRQDRPESHSRAFDSISLDRRRWTEDPGAAQQEQDPGSWAAGWEACASETLRYLVEDEGLPPHHPTVLAMKNHLDLQRERAFAHYSGYTEAKSQDMNLVLD
ncbi:uncharacterized protein LOC114938935 [Nylanderia fulva]|uniref:uncharacterized protein LOC114938935 n=1 Tax=Nylanderia fulva TaxID=613905 RepID=UPI0010FB6ACB|nr:uncharacterized protein LOC114938935 [Nylanderia fulva]